MSIDRVQLADSTVPWTVDDYIFRQTSTEPKSIPLPLKHVSPMVERKSYKNKIWRTGPQTTIHPGNRISRKVLIRKQNQNSQKVLARILYILHSSHSQLIDSQKHNSDTLEIPERLPQFRKLLTTRDTLTTLDIPRLPRQMSKPISIEQRFGKSKLLRQSRRSPNMKATTHKPVNFDGVFQDRQANVLPLVILNYNLDWILRGIATNDPKVANVLIAVDPEIPVDIKGACESVAEENRYTTLRGIFERAQLLLNYRIPGYVPENGRDVAQISRSCTERTWFLVKTLAWEGLLSKYPSGTREVFQGIHLRWYSDGHGHPPIHPEPAQLEEDEEELAESNMEKMRQPVGQTYDTYPSVPPVMTRRQSSTFAKADFPQNEEIQKLARKTLASVSRAAAKVTTVPRSKIKPKISRTAQKNGSKIKKTKQTTSQPLLQKGSESTVTKPKKRKLEQKTNSSNTNESINNENAKKKQRQGFDPNGTKSLSVAERFGKHVKCVFNARSDQNEDYEAFNDAKLPDNSPSVQLSIYSNADDKLLSGPIIDNPGAPDGLHASEVALCRKLKVTYAVYRCQKSRIFLGLAIYTEQNTRRLAQDPQSNIWSVKPSQAQVLCNMDANKTAYMFRRFEEWGWIPEMGIAGNRGSKRLTKVNPALLEQYPTDHSGPLLSEIIEWEDKTVRDSKNRVTARV